MATSQIKNMSNYEHGQGFIRDDQTHGSIKDSDSTRAMYRWEGGDVDRMLEHTFNGSRVEVSLGPTSLKGSWNPSADIVSQPTAFFPNNAAHSEPTIVQKVLARLEEAGVNVFNLPGLSASSLADCLAKRFYLSQETEGGHDVRLLLADYIAELNASLFDVANACPCSADTDRNQAHDGRVFLQRLRPNTFQYVNLFHIHAIPADVYVVGANENNNGGCAFSRPRLTPFGALSELPRLLPENKTKEQLEAIDAMYELIGSPWKVWP